MRRLQRRVRNSNPEQSVSENVSKALTFDRRTFVECSTRMRRLVPTLRRQHNNMPPCDSTTSHPPPPPHQDGGDINYCTIRLNSDEDELSDSYEDKIDPIYNCGTRGEVEHQSSSKKTKQDREIDALGILGAAAIATLPRNTVMTCNPSSSGVSVTLPAPIIETQKDRALGRRIWLKPLTSLVAFMSNIGDNIHITSYPTP